MNYMLLEKLVNIDSPSGYTDNACTFIFDYLKDLGFAPTRGVKGSIHCSLGDAPTLAIAAHVDTLGGMVAGITDHGTLRMSKIGSPSLHAYEGNMVRIHTLSGKVFTGTFQLDNPAKHVNAELAKAERKEQNMHIIIDELVNSKAEVTALGIRVGDVVAFEPHYRETESGFIVSKFMDNKAGCMVLFALAEHYAKTGQKIPVELFFSNYEEVGHGGTVGYGKDVEELLVIDMGVVGDGCDGREDACSICAKDSSGPYDIGMRRKLVALADKENIPYQIDVYPYYGSDGSAALSAGMNFRVGLIGPGVMASHGCERTHKKGIEATVNLCKAYISQF